MYCFKKYEVPSKTRNESNYYRMRIKVFSKILAYREKEKSMDDFKTVDNFNFFFFN